MAAKLTGTCKFFDKTKGYGFITSEAAGEDVYVHYKNLKSSADFVSLADGEAVEFEVETEPETGRKRAVNVTGPAGADVIGNPRRAKKSNNCYTCGLEGHLARECPSGPAPGAGEVAAPRFSAPRGPKTCFHCGAADHLARECPSAPADSGYGAPRGARGGRGGARSGGVGNCYTCGAPGHQSRNCPTTGGAAAGGAVSERTCYNCGLVGHLSRECPEERKERAPRRTGGGGGDRACYTCGNVGHMSRDCTSK